MKNLLGSSLTLGRKRMGMIILVELKMIMGINLKTASKGGNIYVVITKTCIKNEWTDYLK